MFKLRSTRCVSRELTINYGDCYFRVIHGPLWARIKNIYELHEVTNATRNQVNSLVVLIFPHSKLSKSVTIAMWLIAFAIVPSVVAQQQSLEKRVAAEVAQFKGKVSVFAKNLDTGATVSFQGDEPVQTASTIKIAIMIEAFARVAEGKAKWTDELLLTKEKKVGGSGILFEFSDGLRLTLRDATTLMMVLSDNTATNLVIDTFGADAVNARMEALGLKETRLMRRVFGGGESVEGKKPESKRFGLGRTTAKEMVTLVEKLERGEIVSAAASKEMIDLMKREQGTNGIWRHRWRVAKATKSGALDALRSNVGIIYHPRGRIALAITCHEMPEVQWTVDNPALLLMNRLSEIVIEELGNKPPITETK
ncbi:MAG TPA: serine hydrolase [Pyrinomonadaceae bacterium]|nr:serine hydrolase [Pyrinomonadaceae bacterium]